MRSRRVVRFLFSSIIQFRVRSARHVNGPAYGVQHTAYSSAQYNVNEYDYYLILLFAQSHTPHPLMIIR